MADSPIMSLSNRGVESANGAVLDKDRNLKDHSGSKNGQKNDSSTRNTKSRSQNGGTVNGMNGLPNINGINGSADRHSSSAIAKADHAHANASIDPELNSTVSPTDDSDFISSIANVDNKTSTPLRSNNNNNNDDDNDDDAIMPPPIGITTSSTTANNSSSFSSELPTASASLPPKDTNLNTDDQSKSESPAADTSSASSKTTRKRKLSSLGSSFTEEELKIPFSELLEKIQNSGGDGDGNSNGGGANNPLHLTDRQKQLFAFAWLDKHCEESTDSTVPRSRVYARYVSLCSELRLPPLTPATFGKIVNTRFPNIITRRLGTRGQSKYHYCGVRLIGESDLATPYYSTPVKFIGGSGNGNGNGNDSPDTYGSFRSNYYNSSHDYSFYSNSPYTPSSASVNASSVSVLTNGNGHGATSSASASSTTVAGGQSSNLNSTNSAADDGNNDLSKTAGSDARLSTPVESSRLDTTMGDVSLFEDINIPILNEKHDFSIPNLEDYLEDPADPDDVNILYGLYKTYCHTLMDNLRFMQIGKLFKTVQVFVSGMTLSVQRLLARPSVSRWASKIDWMLYKEMVQLLNRLIFDEIPLDVSRRLKTLARNLPTRVEQSLIAVHMPAYLIEMKVESATGFVSVLDRMLRANDASIHAGKILCNAEELAKMKRDWSSYVESSVIASREVPCEFEKVIKILETEIPNLLDSSARLTSQDAEMLGSPQRVVTRAASELGGSNQSSIPPPQQYQLNQQELMEIEFIHFKPEDGIGGKPGKGKGNNYHQYLPQNKKSQTKMGGSGGEVDNDNDKDAVDLTSYDQQSTQLLRWAEFLSSLPDLFSNIPPRVFLLSVSTILTCALKDISVNGGEGFGAWWVVRIWIDEWLGWRAEMGGFLSRPADDDKPESKVSADMVAGNVNAFVNGADFSNFRLSFPFRSGLKVNNHHAVTTNISSEDKEVRNQ